MVIGFGFMNLKTKFILSFLTLSTLSISSIAVGVYYLSIGVFYQKFLDHNLNIATHLGNSIEGDKHKTFTSNESLKDPSFNHYFKYLRKVSEKEENITFIYTLNYNKEKNDYFYAIDPYHIKNDTIWVESTFIGFEVFVDEKGIFKVKHDNFDFEKSFKVDYPERIVVVDIENKNNISSLLINSSKVLEYDHILKKWSNPVNVLKIEEETETNIKIDNENNRFTYYYSLKDSSSSPVGGSYQEKSSSLEQINRAFKEQKTNIMKDPRQIAYGFFLLSVAPILDLNGESVGVVMLEISDRQVREYKKSLYTLFFAIGFIFSIFSIIFSYMLARYLTKPITALSTAAGEIADGNMTVRVNLTRKDEIGSLATSFNTMAQSVESAHGNLVKTNTAYSRFVPMEFLQLLGKESILDVNLNNQIQKEMSVLFTDIRSFTTLSEKMTPEENFNFLNSYLRRVGPLIRHNNGFIDKYIGDAIMALFPASPHDAVQSAVEILQEIRVYNVYRANRNYDPISVGIGIHTGLLMLGTIGEHERMEGTVISDAVNLASRIESLTKTYGVSLLVSEKVLIELKEPNSFNYRMIDNVVVKGKKKPISIFEILDGYSEEQKEKFMDTKFDFELAIISYLNKDFSKAQLMFKKVIDHNPIDAPTRLYIARCEKAIKLGISDDWDGIEVLTHK